MANTRNYSTKTAAAMSENGILNGYRTNMHRRTIDYSFADRTALFASDVARRETVTPKTSMLIETSDDKCLASLKKLAPFALLIILTMSLLAMAGCSGPTQSNMSAPAPPSTGTKNATITADPNPIQVCDGSGTGVTKLTWTSVGPAVVEMHVNSPNGDLLARTGANGTAATAKWVTNGMIFYLQDVSGAKPLTQENTLATVTVKVTTAGCP